MIFFFRSILFAFQENYLHCINFKDQREKKRRENPKILVACCAWKLNSMDNVNVFFFAQKLFFYWLESFWRTQITRIISSHFSTQNKIFVRTLCAKHIKRFCSMLEISALRNYYCEYLASSNPQQNRFWYVWHFTNKAKWPRTKTLTIISLIFVNFSYWTCILLSFENCQQTLMNTNVLRLSLNHPHAFYENEIIAFKKNVANQVSVQSIKAAYTLKQIKLPFRMV